MVQVMSRGWMVSSSKVPASAGHMPAGGSYCGATETPGSGSRPTEYHKANITTSKQRQKQNGIAAHEPAEPGECGRRFDRSLRNINVNGEAAAHGEWAGGF